MDVAEHEIKNWQHLNIFKKPEQIKQGKKEINVKTG